MAFVKNTPSSPLQRMWQKLFILFFAGVACVINEKRHENLSKESLGVFSRSKHASLSLKLDFLCAKVHVFLTN